MIECIWATVTAVILVQITVPSFLFLYMLDDSVAVSLTTRDFGAQCGLRDVLRDCLSPGVVKMNYVLTDIPSAAMAPLEAAAKKLSMILFHALLIL